MNISYNWLKEYVQTDLTPDEVAVALTSIGLEVGGVEEVETIKGGLAGIVVGEVLTCEPHPNSDHMHVTTVNLGDGGEPVQIVCGAPNVRAGQKVIVATLGTKLYDGDTAFTIKKSKLRGVESNGMICAEDEIGIGINHDGIIVLPADAVPGTPAKDYYHIKSEYVIEVDITPNRADACRMTSGWQKSDLIIIAARPAMGKTAFVLSMAKNIAVNNKMPIALFSLEMSNIQLVNRLICNVCEISGDKIKSGQLVREEWAMLDYHLKELSEAPLYIDDTPSLSIFELRTKARRLVREHNIQMIIIDYLQLMNGGLAYGSRQEEVSTISRSLKGLAKELDIPVIALSQLNRGVENREGIEGKRPQLSDLRESGAIEQDADIVCFIHRPEYYHIYEDDKGNDLHGLAEIIVAKHRNGSVGDVRLRFESALARFRNLNENSIRDAEAVYGSKRNRKMRGNASPEGMPPAAPMPDIPPLPDQDDPFRAPSGGSPRF